MDSEIKKIKEEIDNIKDRNTRVENEKAWELSGTRVLSITILTYAFTVILFYILGTKLPWLSALVPTLGYYLSTRSVSIIKKRWTKNLEKKKGLADKQNP